MKLEELGRKFGFFLKDNTPLILTATAVAGVVSTAILAVRATPQAMRDIWDAEQDLNLYDPEALTTRDDRTTRELVVDRVKVTWKLYLPAALSGAATIACIIGAHTTHTRRGAAIMSAYTLTERAYREYREELVRREGESKDEKIRSGISEKNISENPPKDSQVILAGGESLCYDSVSGRYFKSDIETIRRAVNDVNQSVINHMYVSHNDFYLAIGLPPVSLGEELGWTTDNMMEIDFSSILTEENKPALYLDYRVGPIRDYYKVN